jgi:hypothetical protein
MVTEDLLQEAWHLGFVVHDVEKTAKRLETLLGITSWTIKKLEPNFATVHGKDVTHVIKLAMGNFGNLGIELLQPVTGKSVYTEHLQKKGESFHHIAIRIPESKLKDVMVQLKEEGGKVIQTGQVGTGSGYYYIDLKELGLILELNPSK